MTEELELPSDLYGFGSLLLWVLATRATQIVDSCYADGPARPSPRYGVVDGHPVPTPSLVAWLLTAAESGLPLDALTRRDGRLDRRQHVLRTIVSRVLKGRSELFENRWLNNLAVICRLGRAEMELLATSRDEAGHPVDPEALRRAIAQTMRSRPAASPPTLRAPAVTRTLPRDITSFTGREPELRQIVAAVAAAPAGQVVGVHAVGGMAGVGKTAFAVHAAHQVASRFPDGQVFLSLHGHTPGQSPVTPEDALERLLQISGVATAHIPHGLEARATLWRDHLAGKQLLLLLDDATGHEQVRPLLPGAWGSLVIITSRRRLTALEDAHSISLDTLSPGEAARLLVQLAGRPGLRPGDAEVGQITQLCGYLPLAVGMQGRRLHHHPAWTAADLAADLATAHDRLELMQAENLSVAAAFELSYQDLDENERRFFRQLSLHPGDDIDACAAAALDDTSLANARRHLESLYDQYLLSEPVRGRYRPHDLIREHARTLAALDPAADRDRALERLLDYYEYTATLAEELLAREPRTAPASAAVTAPPVTVPALPDRQRALAWARAERTNLLGCLDHATQAGQHARVIALTAAIAGLLRHDGSWIDAISRHTTSMRAAQRLGDRLGEANAQHEIATIRRLTGDYQAALEAQQAALDIYSDLGNDLGRGNALHEAGTIRRLTGDYRAAAAAQQAALDIYRRLGNRLGQANALHEQGAINYLMGDYPVAMETQQAALDIYRDLGHGLGQADALLYVGAVTYLRGDGEGAAEVLQEALRIYRDHGYQQGQANALQQMGVARLRNGDHAGAAEAFETALEICRELGYRAGEANALHYLGASRRLSADHEGAVEAVEAALRIYRDIGDPGGEAEALNEAGTLQRIRGRFDQAQASHQAALELAREINSTWDEAHALAGLGRCAQAGHRAAAAQAYLEQARDAFSKINADEAADVAAELAALTEPELTNQDS
jgi:tetratricopeptide (TPR) repeat protein/DNA-binding transcriptional ArsR family regulator